MKPATIALLGALLTAAPSAAEPPPPPTVSVAETAPGVYAVEATFDVPHEAAVAWEVLTDYANISRYVPEVRRSVVLERTGSRARVEQEAVSKFLMFSKRVHLLLAIRESEDVIAFTDECGRSFTLYAGSWRLTDHAEGTRIAYLLRAQPAFDVPDFLVSRLLSRDATAMIQHLRAEMARRAQVGR